jgi:hypothetical protein
MSGSVRECTVWSRMDLGLAVSPWVAILGMGWFGKGCIGAGRRAKVGNGMAVWSGKSLVRDGRDSFGSRDMQVIVAQSCKRQRL